MTDNVVRTNEEIPSHTVTDKVNWTDRFIIATFATPFLQILLGC